MGKRIGEYNDIDISAEIDANIELGSYNVIGKNVVIKNGSSDKLSKIVIGDCNIIHDNTKIIVGEEGIIIGDWNVFHNNILIVGLKRLEIGHNCWFGQNTVIDSSGALTIGNGVRVGMYSQIWTHVASGELIEGCLLNGFRKTVIEDDVWLVGSCIVSSGITLRRRTIALINSNITKDTIENSVYAGSPAKLKENLKFYKEISVNDKLQLMDEWVNNFVLGYPEYHKTSNNESIIISTESNEEEIIISWGIEPKSVKEHQTYMDLNEKKYTKKLTNLERCFYKSIYGFKARFVPFD